jgi:transposase
MMDQQTMGSGTRRTVRKFTTEQRQQIVAESHEAGTTVREVAQRHGIGPTLLSMWRQQAAKGVRAATRHAGFAAVRVATASRSTEGVIEIDLDHRVVRVRGTVDGAMLREVLAAAR